MVLGRFALALAVTLPMVLGGIVGVNAFIDQKVASIPRVKLNTAPNTENTETTSAETRMLSMGMAISPLARRDAYREKIALI